MSLDASRSSRDAVRSLFGIAVALGLATLVLREIHEVRLAYESLGFVAFAAWFAAAVSVVASLVEVARDHRMRSLYFAVALVAGHLLAFSQEMDGGVRSIVAAFLWALLGGVIVAEGASLLRQRPPVDEIDA
ncbi:MAG: hypothetical protein AAGF11_29575 [Myxococcota bacterium]